MENTPDNLGKPRHIPSWVVIIAFLLLAGFLAMLAFSLRNPAVVVGQVVPPITMTTFGGQQIHTADYKGKVVVLNFWASWCGPCVDEAPMLQKAWDELQPTGKVVFIGVDYLDSDIKALPYLKQYGVTYSNGPDLRTSISSIFRISGVPETYIIGPDGRLAFVKVGPFTSAQDVVQLVNLYLPQE